MNESRSQSNDTPAPTSSSPAMASATILFGACIAAGIVGYLIHEHAEFFRPSQDLMDRAAEVTGVELPPDLAAEVRVAETQAHLQNIRLAYAIIGMTTASLIAVAAAVGHGSLVRSMVGMVLGCLIGGLVGVGAGSLAVSLETMLDINNKLDATFEAMAIQAAAWMLIAAAVWITFQITLGKTDQPVQSLITVILFAGIGAALYPIVAALIFVDRTALPVPEGLGNRLFWAFLMNLLIALGLALSGRRTATDSTTVAADNS